MRKYCSLLILVLFISCSQNKSIVEVVYTINEFSSEDNRLNITLDITNKTNKDISSLWSLHWNQISALVDSESLPNNTNYEYVAGQSYNILSFEDNYSLKKGETISIDLKQRGGVKRKSDFPMGGFIVTNGNIIDVKFINLWENAEDIQDLNIPTANDRFNYNYSNRLLDKSQLDLIVPTPNKIDLLEGQVDLKTKYSINIDESLNLDFDFAKSLMSGVAKIVLDDEQADIKLSFVENLANESYELIVNNDNILIIASDRAGALYGLQSLKQIFLVAKLENTSIRNLKINDSPKFSYRGMLLDISRNFYGPKKIKQILDYLSFFKINHLDFRLTDDEGWRLEIPGLEELTEVGSKRGYTKDESDNLIPIYGSGPDSNSSPGSGYLSKADFIDILKYANQRNITIIPQISYPSHIRSAIVSMNARYQKYMRLGDKDEAEKYLLIDPDDESEYYSAQGFDDNIVCICRESAFTFYEKVIDEVYLMYQEAGIKMKNFGVGADELPFGAWRKSPLCDKFMEEKSITGDYDALYQYQQRRIYDKLSSYGLTMTGWDDILLKLTEKNQSETQIKDFFKDDDILLFVWKNDWGGGRQDMIYKYANLGYKTIMSNSSAFYFDMVDDKDFDNIGLSWSGYADYKDMWTVDVFDVFNDSYGVKKNNISTDYINKSEKINPNNKDNIIGVQSQIWSETIVNEDVLDYMFMPNIIVFSQKAWSQDHSWMNISDKELKDQTLEMEWNKFTNNIGQRVLPIVDNIFGGLSYDLPKPGGIIVNDSLYANTIFPGLDIKYTIDGTVPNSSSENYTIPIKIKTDDIVHLRLFDKTGRGGNKIKVNK
ncbi:MAG: family 20 glycosylhydrolase [Bacteroidota bacterium]|nr:family 20 glycosylhydrolase [Bacteroidota bacterium]